MAYYSIFPEIDTTLYSHPDRTAMNTGGDEILELVKERGTTNTRHYPSRILIKFKNEEIKSTISDTIGSSKFNDGTTEVALQLLSTEPKSLTQILNIETFLVSQSWHEGSGRYSNLPTSSNGATWAYRDNSTTETAWGGMSTLAGIGYSSIGIGFIVGGYTSQANLNTSTGVSFSSIGNTFIIGAYTASGLSPFSPGTTGSINTNIGIEAGGGVWYTGSCFTATQQFLNNENLDINLDVTCLVQKHSASLFANSAYPTGVPNNGFIIKHPKSVEENTSSSFGEMQYFSVDTHTIYPPKLTFKWDDSVHNYQSTSKKSGSLNVTLYKNKQEFNQNDEALLRIHVRDKYPTRQFASSSNYLNPGYFTTASYYSIRDAHTEEEVIPFDTSYTKLSSDSEGMYFKIFMKGLQPERYYRILFKHKNNEGTKIYDNKYHFKVVR